MHKLFDLTFSELHITFFLQAENIYEDPCNFDDLRIDLQSEDESVDEPLKVSIIIFFSDYFQRFIVPRHT